MASSAQYGTVLAALLVGIGTACDGDEAPASDVGGQKAGTAGQSSGGGGSGGSAGVGPVDGSGGANAPDGCSTCRLQGSDLALRRGGGLGFCIKDNQFISAEIRRNAAGALVLSGSFYVGCDGCGTGTVSDHTVTIPPMVLTAEHESKLMSLTTGFVPQSCSWNPVNCEWCLVITAEVGGCSYRDYTGCVGDEENAAQLEEFARYVDSLGVAATAHRDQ